MKTVCKQNACTGCSACIEICPRSAIEIRDFVIAYNAVIDNTKCVNCNLCHSICPNNNAVEDHNPISWHQGWVNDEEERACSSSGGFASAIAKAFVKAGGVVWSCEFKDAKFVFSEARTEEEVNRFRGSKYIKSNPAGIYKVVKQELKEGTKVLFIGLPCQVAGLKNFVGTDYWDLLYSIDLICHGTPSPSLLNDFLNQDYGLDLSELKEISFRAKFSFKLHKENIPLVPNRVKDRYTMAFLNSVDYTENCYACNYAKLQRISDLTIGDSWGSELPVEERKKGISLALCMTAKGEELLRIANLIIKEVDLQQAVKTNTQLVHPAVLTHEWESFMKQYEKRKNFSRAVRAALPKMCFKEDVKYLLAKAGILRGGY